MNLPGSSLFCFPEKPNFDLISSHDTVVVQRCCLKHQFEALRIFQQLEMKIVFDLDDDVWDIPPMNPAAGILGQLREGFAACIQMVDVVTVSTKTLAKIVQKRVPNLVNLHKRKEIPIIVVENKIDPKLFAKPIIPSEQIVVGWAGSSSHLEDLLLIAPVIEKLAHDYPRVIFEFRGQQPPDSLASLPNVRHIGWAPVAEFAARMPLWGWSIAMAPVTDHPFNHSKSPIKMVEAAYCGIPCVASWVTPYQDFTHWDKRLQWLLAPNQASWEIRLRGLIEDEALRLDLGARAQAVALAQYSWETPHEGWKQVASILNAL